MGYLVILQDQVTDAGTPNVVFFATFIGGLSALSLAAAVLRDRDIRGAQTLLYAAAGGYLPAGVVGLMSVGLPLIVAGMLAVAAAGPRLIPRAAAAAAAMLSLCVFVAGVALAIRVS